MPLETLTRAPIEDITRRRFLTAFPALGIVAAGIACSDDDAAPEEPTPSAPTTRTINAAFGTVEVPANPKRVVVADNVALPYILELGVVPIAAGTLEPSYFGGHDFHPALYDLGIADSVPFQRDTPDYELVARMQPDLIIGSTFALVNRVADGVETYRKLAPVAAVDSDLPVFEQIRGYAQILGREAEAEKLIADFESSIRSIATRVSVEEISIARAFGDSQIFIYTEKEPFTSLWLDLLGVKVVPGPKGASASGTIIAPAERLGELKGEALVVIFGIERLEQNPLWPLLPAVQAGNVHHAGDYLVYSGNGGLNALREQIIGIAEFLASIG